MRGTIENRDAFLNKIAKKMNRQPEETIKEPVWSYQPQWAVHQNESKNQLVELIKRVSQSIHTKVIETDTDHLPQILNQTIHTYGGGRIVATNDGRFAEFGLTEVLKQNNVYVWNTEKGHENIDRADEANIGLSVCDVMLAESATAGFFHDKDKARSVSLLPVTSIVIVPESAIVPRLTQAMKMVEDKVATGEKISPYINFISGPSNSADIEMRLVVGVHGPVKVAYILVQDV
ncbi:lactate utilization protein C [Sporolactobacillus sp. Y61]|uniref:Lactate utilization protein C n=1 Tax=Sporolactobacillus sp. Y61 TaxID=3160863 RepID=A0AAU8IDV3_9BACL|nr:lactate utilization protein C [Sporolactobacillus sp. THM19-2]RYL93132.1 lactate utilization protein C [Sporolactobacillus sp. THM19-2]